MSIVVRSLQKRYGEQKAVDDVSFTVANGKITGFLGPNGAGKSTTMKMITGYLKPDSGSVTVSDIDVTHYPIAAKRKIGYLPEANPLYFDMYVKEYLEYIADIHRLSEKKQKIAGVIELTGINTESKKKIGQLSKGYKQRVGLAAALIHDPEVLVLDEPTSGLDPNQIIEIRNVIKQQGQLKTVLFSSHILQEVAAVCDNVIIINKGRLVANDTLSNLQQAGNNSVVKVSFKEILDADLLTNLNGVQLVNRLNDYSWQITASNTGAIKKLLLELSLQRNLNIVSLQSEEGNLEEIFKTLTNPQFQNTKG